MKAGKAYRQTKTFKTKSRTGKTTVNTQQMTGRQQYKLAKSADKTRRLSQNLRAEQIRAIGQAGSQIVGSAVTPSALRESGDIAAQLRAKERESAKQMNDQMNKWLEIMTSNPDTSKGDEGKKNEASPSSGSKLGG